MAGGSEVPPQPLIYLSAILKKAGFTVEIIDANALRWSLEETVDSIIARSPKVVGITAPTMLIATAGLISEKVKGRNKDILAVVGGPHITAVPEETMAAYPHIDIGVIGEGEITAVELMKAVSGSGKRSLDPVDGIIYRHNGGLKMTRKREYIKDLDTLPMPDWGALPDILSHYQ
ncbi:MAG: cobalamin-dependent protein, partial [Candidatus Omnitrophica bacterium]|nr:cobalamin-dependent protein [Candidatus Omnitrophota bacterium]